MQSAIHSVQLKIKSIHDQVESGDPLGKLPVEITLRARQLFTSVLKYAYELLTLDTMMKVGRAVLQHPRMLEYVFIAGYNSCSFLNFLLQGSYLCTEGLPWGRCRNGFLRQ